MDDREIARRAIEFQKTAKDYRMLDVPGYTSWSERKLNEGESADLIAHLDAMAMCLTPADLKAVSESSFEELLAELKAEIE
jgi:hypothetical protein